MAFSLILTPTMLGNCIQGNCIQVIYPNCGETRQDNIRNIHGAALARELLELSETCATSLQYPDDQCETLSSSSCMTAYSLTSLSNSTRPPPTKYTPLTACSPSVKVDAHLSNPNYSMKRMTFVLFINGRLVECK